MDPKKARAFERLNSNVADIWRPEFDDDFYLFRWVKARQFRRQEGGADAARSSRMARENFAPTQFLEEFAMPTVLADYYTGGLLRPRPRGPPGLVRSYRPQ
uniref:FRG domain-containing protein n=1 Tax=Macrostomum lignano TaxID=282301 RepID=A0A1I8F9J4_9PLAT